MIMKLSDEYRNIIGKWFQDFIDDEDQISLEMQIDESKDLPALLLQCGDDTIIITFYDTNDTDNNTSMISIRSDGNDKFVNRLIKKMNEAIQINASLNSNLREMLGKFSEISKGMASDNSYWYLN